MLSPRGVSTAHRIQTKFGRSGNLPNVITHEIKLCHWRRVEVSSCFSTTTADAINTANSCRILPVIFNATVGLNSCEHFFAERIIQPWNFLPVNSDTFKGLYSYF